MRFYIGRFSLFSDEIIKIARNSRDPTQVPVGPVTKVRVKRFKKVLNNLIQRALQQEIGAQINIEPKGALIMLIQTQLEE